MYPGEEELMEVEEDPHYNLLNKRKEPLMMLIEDGDEEESKLIDKQIDTNENKNEQNSKE